MRATARGGLAGLALVMVVLALAACGGSSEPSSSPGRLAAPAAGAPTIVVTYSVLGSLVSDLVGDAARVRVLMPNGVDPHDWQPSAKDVEAVGKAGLVVRNGLALEEGLEDAIDEAAAAGIPVFTATDHVELRTIGEGEGGGEHPVGADDPHIWTDPATMRAVMAALATELEQRLGLDLAARAADLDARLADLDAELERTLGAIPPERRKLVTGHESMGYFARRYGFTLVGALIPSISSQAQASAAELADLKDTIEREGATTIFTEIGTPRQVAETIADETGARVVELPSHNLPDDGSYFTFMREIATRVADGLAA